MEINKKLDLTEEEIYSLEMHAFINIITLMYNNLFIMSEKLSNDEIFEDAMERVYELAYGVKSRDRNSFNPGKIRKFRDSFQKLFLAIEQKKMDKKVDDFVEIKNFFTEATHVVESRMDDLLLRWSNPNKWKVHWVEEFKDTFLNYFYALEKKSDGLYQITQSVEVNSGIDFDVTFEISSVLGHSITIPINFKDMLREVVSNARKFSKPGGKIHILLELRDHLLVCIVKDKGIGIPKDEIDKIIDLRYRASNAREYLNYSGNGFGLTKVYFNLQKLNGKLLIDSELNRGTTVQIEIPVPDQ